MQDMYFDIVVVCTEWYYVIAHCWAMSKDAIRSDIVPYHVTLYPVLCVICHAFSHKASLRSHRITLPSRVLCRAVVEPCSVAGTSRTRRVQGRPVPPCPAREPGETFNCKDNEMSLKYNDMSFSDDDIRAEHARPGKDARNTQTSGLRSGGVPFGASEPSRAWIWRSAYLASPRVSPCAVSNHKHVICTCPTWAGVPRDPPAAAGLPSVLSNVSPASLARGSRLLPRLAVSPRSFRRPRRYPPDRSCISGRLLPSWFLRVDVV